MSNGPKVGEKKFQVPHVFILLFAIIVFATILTWIVPAGEFDRIEDPTTGRMVAVAGTWHEVEAAPVGIFQMFKAVYDGMLDAADISMLIFITFASTTFIIKSGAFDGLVVFLMKVFKGNSSVIIIPIFMALFGLGSSTVGMFEEWLPFIPVFASIFIGIGFDAIVGLAVVALGAGIGYSGAFMNPFTVGVAHGIAGLPLVTGVGFRLACHAVMLVVGSFFVIRYALKIKKDPTKSLVYGTVFAANEDNDVENKEFGIRQILVLIVLVITIAILVFGVQQYGWYFAEISTLFLIMAIVVAIIMGYGPNTVGTMMASGFEAAAMAALIVGIARGIRIVLEAGCIIDSVVYGLAIPLGALPTWLAAIAMLILQTLLNFFVPSGSGQAAVSIPIMAPLGDLLGINRDISVLAYQFGDGLSNSVWPTAYGAVMAGLAGVRLDKWWKFVFPVFGALILTQAVLMIIAVATNFGG